MGSGQRLIGAAVVEYGVDTAETTRTRPVLLAKAGARAIIDVTSMRDGGSITGLFLDCRGSSANGISSGSFQLSVDQVTIVRCANGLGDEAVPYTAALHISNTTFGSNGTGIRNLVDSFVERVDFANNKGDGLYLGAGSNSNLIANSRFEWNQGAGLDLFGESHVNAVSNCIFDRNAKAGLRLVGVLGFSMSNSQFFRNGRNQTPPDQNSQIFLSNAHNVIVQGGVMTAGRDDGGTGPLTPATVFSFDRPFPSTNITFIGVMTSGKMTADNPYGGFTETVVRGPEPVTGYNVSGVTDLENRKIPRTGKISRITSSPAALLSMVKANFPGPK
eukprot:gene13880-13995_t